MWPSGQGPVKCKQIGTQNDKQKVPKYFYLVYKAHNIDQWVHENTYAT